MSGDFRFRSIVIPQYELSVLIAARNEEFLSRTVEGVLAAREATTEVIVVLDGAWASPPLRDHPDVTIIHHSQSIGQRAAINEAARLSRARFVMKLDAHCLMDRGFDRKLIEDCQDGWLLIPTQFNLHAFNWKCKKCGREWDQSPTPQHCMVEGGKDRAPNPECDNTTDFERVMVWRPRKKTESWRFDRDLIFGYFGDYPKRHDPNARILDTMSLLGACWFQDRERYWELGGLDEEHGSWGQMGTELSLKNWTSGGAVKVTRNTFFAHLFRTQGGDFGFPYPCSVHKAREHSQHLWKSNSWPLQKRTVSAVVRQFMPIPGWDESDIQSLETEEAKKSIPKTLTKGIVYYTHNELDPVIAQTVRDRIKMSVNGHSVVSVSLKPIELGKNIVLNEEKGYLTYLKQILAGLKASNADVIFMCEHDVVYNESHFSFIPPRSDRYYYNLNVYKLRPEDGHALHYDCCQVSGLCAYRELLIQHYEKRIEKFLSEGKYDRRTGYEPGMRPPPTGIDEYGYETWRSDIPLVDIRVAGTMSKSRWSKEQFRNKRTCENWIEGDAIPHYGVTKNRFAEFLMDLRA